MIRFVALVWLALSAALGLTACSGMSDSMSSGPAAQPNNTSHGY